MKNLVFIHQNFPGQFIHLARYFLGRSGYRLFGIGMADNLRTVSHQNLTVLSYPMPQRASDQTHHYAMFYEHSIRYGQSVARCLQTVRETIRQESGGRSSQPDLIVAHPSWGEAMFIKDIFPASPLVLYNEYFDADPNPVANFDAEFPTLLDESLRNRARQATQLVSQLPADAGLSPMAWQRSLFPQFVQAKTRVIFDGIDTNIVRPGDFYTGQSTRLANQSINKAQPPLRLQFPSGDVVFHAGEEIITYTSRNLEPHRGFHVLMRALPDILQMRPRARVLIVGGDDVSYSQKPSKHANWRLALLAEWQQQGKTVDFKRVFILPKLDYSLYLKVLQISSVHIYLTYPSVLSWSFMEALSCGALVVASKTQPVTEVIEHGKNGLLVDFFDKSQLLATLNQVLNTPQDFIPLRVAARATIESRYALQQHCLPAQLKLFDEIAGVMRSLTTVRAKTEGGATGSAAAQHLHTGSGDKNAADAKDAGLPNATQLVGNSLVSPLHATPTLITAAVKPPKVNTGASQSSSQSASQPTGQPSGVAQRKPPTILR